MVLNKQLTFLDLFSGIGGFRIGLERAGFKSIGYCDNDEYANKLYKAYFNTEEELFFDDIRTINTEELPDFDILCGGFWLSLGIYRKFFITFFFTPKLITQDYCFVRALILMNIETAFSGL